MGVDRYTFVKREFPPASVEIGCIALCVVPVSYSVLYFLLLTLRVYYAAF